MNSLSFDIFKVIEVGFGPLKITEKRNWISYWHCLRRHDKKVATECIHCFIDIWYFCNINHSMMYRYLQVILGIKRVNHFIIFPRYIRGNNWLIFVVDAVSPDARVCAFDTALMTCGVTDVMSCELNAGTGCATVGAWSAELRLRLEDDTVATAAAAAAEEPLVAGCEALILWPLTCGGQGWRGQHEETELGCIYTGGALLLLWYTVKSLL